MFTTGARAVEVIGFVVVVLVVLFKFVFNISIIFFLFSVIVSLVVAVLASLDLTVSVVLDKSFPVVPLYDLFKVNAVDMCSLGLLTLWLAVTKGFITVAALLPVRTNVRFSADLASASTLAVSADNRV